MTFDDVLVIINGRNQRAVENPNGKYPIYGSGGIMGYADSYICEADTVVIGRKGSINNPIFVEEPFWNVDTAFGLAAKREILLPRYLYYFCRSFDFERLNKAVTIPSLTKSDLLKIEIMLPTLEIQEDVVNKLRKVEQIIQARKQQLQKLDELVKARFVELFGDAEFNTMQWPTKKLSELCNVGSSKRIYQSEQCAEGVPFLRISDLNERIDNVKNAPELFIPTTKYNELKEADLVPTAGDILLTSRGTLGRCYIVRQEDEFYFQDGMISWLSDLNNQITSVYLSQLFAMSGIQKQIASLQAGSTVAYLSISMLKKLNIMLPPLDRQKQFSAFVQQTDKSKLAISESLTGLETLKNSLMQQYFG